MTESQLTAQPAGLGIVLWRNFEAVVQRLSSQGYETTRPDGRLPTSVAKMKDHLAIRRPLIIGIVPATLWMTWPVLRQPNTFGLFLPEKTD